MAKRVIVDVKPTGDGDWKAQTRGASRAAGVFEGKQDAIDKAKGIAKAAPTGQVVIRNEKGKIQTEYTYGKDPYPPKG